MTTTGIDHLGLERVLRRGTGEIIEQHEQALFVRDTVSGAFLLACEDIALGREILSRRVVPSCRLLMVSDHTLGTEAFHQHGFSDLLECYQAAWYGAAPQLTPELTVREAGEQDLPLLLSAYDLIGADELRQIVERKKLLLGYDGEQCVGFVGEHLEGSMGLLFVFPAFRRKGYAAALERFMISRTLAEGYTPFGQVEKNNPASLALQKKIGMTVSENLISWMWR